MKKPLFILAVLIIPLILTFFSGCGPIAKITSGLKSLAMYSPLTQWKEMRARNTEQGTNVHWRLYVWLVFPNSFIAYLQGNQDYPVLCSPYLTPSDTFEVAEGDWVEVEGVYRGVTSRGQVNIGLRQLNNLGPKN